MKPIIFYQTQLSSDFEPKTCVMMVLWWNSSQQKSTMTYDLVMASMNIFIFTPMLEEDFFMNTLLKWHDLDGSCIASPTPSDLSSFHLHLDPGCCCTGVQGRPGQRVIDLPSQVVAGTSELQVMRGNGWPFQGAGERFRWWFTAWLGG